MVWVKFRKEKSYGCDEWNYFHINDSLAEGRSKKDIKEYVKDAHESVDDRYSDHYRGMTIKFIDSPPKEWVTDKILRLKQKQEFIAAQIKMYELMIENAK